MFNTKKALKIIVFASLAIFSGRMNSQAGTNAEDISLLRTYNPTIKNENDFKIYILRESFKAHLYEVRNSANAPDFARIDNPYYSESVYTWFINKLRDVVLDRNVNKRLLEYSENLGYEPIENHTQSNFNALVAWNTIDMIVNQGAEAKEGIITAVRRKIDSTNRYRKYTNNLNIAMDVVKDYMDGLKMYKFLTNLQKAQTRYNLAGFASALNNIENVSIQTSTSGRFNVRYSDNTVFTMQIEQSRVINNDINKTNAGLQQCPRGIPNLGNTCFYNSTMQYLYSSQGFRKLIEKMAKDQRERFYEKAPHNTRPTHIAIVLNNIFNTIGCNPTRVADKTMNQYIMQARNDISAIMEKHGHKFYQERRRGNQVTLEPVTLNKNVQHDAHELVMRINDVIEEEIIQLMNKTNKIIRPTEKQTLISQYESDMYHKLLVNKAISTIRCPNCYCRHIATCMTDEPVWGLSINNQKSTLHQCISEYEKSETLTPGNEWLCDKCKRKVQATKQLKLTPKADTLMIQLKRFKYDMTGRIGNKLTTAIDYPELITFDNREWYHLKSAIYHVGGANGGHYYAQSYAEDGTIYEANDATISKKQVLEKNTAYMLMYEKVRK